jgi:hypothetical protein
MSKPTQKKIRDAVGITNVNQLIKLAKEDNVDLGKRKETQIKRAYEYFGEYVNETIIERNKQLKKVKKVINKNIIIDETEKALNNISSLQFDTKMINKCEKLIGKNEIYIQLTNKDNGKIIINEIHDITGKSKGNIWWEIRKKYLTLNGSDGEYLLEQFDFRLVIMIADKLPSKKLQQSFRDGAKHCVIQPLYNLWSKYAENAESKASKLRCIQKANKIKKLEEKFPNGVPENDMEEVAKEASRCIIIHDIIGNEVKRLHPNKVVLYVSSEKFINQFMDHKFLP